MYDLIHRESTYREKEQQHQKQDVGEQNMQAELKGFLNELKKHTGAGGGSGAGAGGGGGAANKHADSFSAVNFPTANESAFGSYTPF
jgi:hypothetical protein